MKKRLFALLLALTLALSLFTACGSALKSEAASYDECAEEECETAEAYFGDYDTVYAAGVTASNGTEAGGISNGETVQTASAEMSAEKIIYSANAELETTEFDAAVEGITAMTSEYGGFMESTSISGSDYYTSSRGGRSLRNAYFTIRIPAERFKEFTGTLSTLGNVPYLNTSSENITASYYDTESRMKAYKTQETRLLEMLAIAETVDDMLAIQAQLTEVQYEIDSLQSRLTNYDRQVSYSTVYLNINEVEEYTAPPAPVNKTYWEKMRDGFFESLEEVKDFFTELFLFIGSNLPAIVVWVLAIVLLIRILRAIFSHRGTTRKERRSERKAAKAAKKADKAARKAAKKTSVPVPTNPIPVKEDTPAAPEEESSPDTPVPSAYWDHLRSTAEEETPAEETHGDEVPAAEPEEKQE